MIIRCPNDSALVLAQGGRVHLDSHALSIDKFEVASDVSSKVVLTSIPGGSATGVDEVVLPGMKFSTPVPHQVGHGQETAGVCLAINGVAAPVPQLPRPVTQVCFAVCHFAKTTKHSVCVLLQQVVTPVRFDRDRCT